MSSPLRTTSGSTGPGQVQPDLDQARAEMDRLRQELDSGKQAAQPSRRKTGAQTSPRTQAAEES